MTLTAVDNGGSGVKRTYYRLDGGSWYTLAAPWWFMIPEGQHTLSYYSVDNANNTEVTHVSNSFWIDPAAPVTGCDAVNDQAYYGARTFTLTPTDSGGTGVASTSWRLDGGSWTSGTSISVPAPSSGTVSHTLSWYSTDLATNAEAIQSVTFTVGPASVGSQAFAFSGGDQIFTVPAGVSVLTVDLWGGSGSGYSWWDYSLSDDMLSASGGLGGHVQAFVPVTPGQVLTVKVGGAGDSGWPNGAGGGGGSTSLLSASVVIAEAGGGGGAGEGTDGGPGGAQGTLPGGNQAGDANGGGGGWNGGGANGGGTSYIAAGSGDLHVGTHAGTGSVRIGW